MIDSISEGRLKIIYPDVAVRWRRVAQDFFECHAKNIRIAQGLRLSEAQLKIWSQGRRLNSDGTWEVTEPKKVVTHAPPGFSLHEFGCAIDSCFIGSDPFLEKEKKSEFYWSELARFGKLHGFKAGFDWVGKKKDRPHLELSYGIPLIELRQLFAANGLKAVWARFDQVRGVPQGSEWDEKKAVKVLNIKGV